MEGASCAGDGRLPLVSACLLSDLRISLAADRNLQLPAATSSPICLWPQPLLWRPPADYADPNLEQLTVLLPKDELMRKVTQVWYRGSTCGTGVACAVP